jgi:cytochrome c biogenesis protein CcmG, thiol:disulfide interchange protein DsbE
MSTDRSSTDGAPEIEPAPRGQGGAVLAALALAAGVALIPRATRGCETSLNSDEEAPDFTARVVANGDLAVPTVSADGGDEAARQPKATLQLSSLRGQAVLLDFWATWCGPCQAETPIINTIAARYKNRGLAVLGVNTSDADGLAAVFAKKKSLRFPIIYDDDNRIANLYHVGSLPTLVLVSKTGRIVAIRHGVTSDAALDDIVRRYL